MHVFMTGGKYNYLIKKKGEKIVSRFHSYIEQKILAKLFFSSECPLSVFFSSRQTKEHMTSTHIKIPGISWKRYPQQPVPSGIDIVSIEWVYTPSSLYICIWNQLHTIRYSFLFVSLYLLLYSSSASIVSIKCICIVLVTPTFFLIIVTWSTSYLPHHMMCLRIFLLWLIY